MARSPFMGSIGSFWRPLRIHHPQSPQSPRGRASYRDMRWEREAKICAKYVQNMRNPENGIGSATPYLITHMHFCDKIWWHFDKKCLLNLSTPKATFLRKILVFWGVQISWTSQHIHPKPIVLIGFPWKIVKKNAQICGNMRSTSFPLQLHRNPNKASRPREDLCLTTCN